MRSHEEQFLVLLGDRPVGRLYRKNDLTRFAFDPSYWDDPDRHVLGLRFEDDPRAQHRSSMRLPPWFSNLLPEGRLREWIAFARRASIAREMELLAQVGQDLPGAVRVVAADEMLPVDLSDQGQLDALAPRSAGSPWTFSLAGVGLKFSMLQEGDRLTIPASGEDGDWIVKLPDPIYRDVPRNEFAMMTLARAVGIDVPEVRLVPRDEIEWLPDRAWSSGEALAYAVKRFDRGPDRRRFHIEDLAQVRGFYPEKKYDGTFETVGSLIYRRKNVVCVQEFARRLAFSILIGNGDAHLKNWSLIYRDGRNATLAPAYDLVATFVYRRDIDGPEEIALKFGGVKRLDRVSIEAFIRLEQRLGVKVELGDLVREVVEGVLSKWPIAEENLAESPGLAGRIKGYIDERAAQLLRR